MKILHNDSQKQNTFLPSFFKSQTANTDHFLLRASSLLASYAPDIQLYRKQINSLKYTEA